MEKFHKQYYNVVYIHYSTPEKSRWISLCPSVVGCRLNSSWIWELEIAREHFQSIMK